MDYTFDKSLVLSKQTEIDILFSKGKRVKNSVFTILYREIPLIDTPFQVLISVPKRRIKKAVQRNYIKRCIREVLRKNKVLLIHKGVPLKKAVMYAIIYHTSNKLTYGEIEKQLIVLLQKTED